MTSIMSGREETRDPSCGSMAEAILNSEAVRERPSRLLRTRFQTFQKSNFHTSTWSHRLALCNLRC